MPHDPDSLMDTDEQLAVIIDQLLQRHQKGERVDLSVICKQHPGHADEIRKLWGAIALTHAVGVQQGRSNVADSSEENKADHLPTQLPMPLGDYILEEELGRGGMGVVYRARQISLQREVAIKMILKGDLASDKDRQRFLREAEAAARLNHPNIVSVFEVGNIEGRLFLSMRLISGMPLSQLLLQGPLPASQAAEIMQKVASAISFAHSQGVLHRDLKPSNILLGKSGMPYVADFGLAKQLSTSSSLTGSDNVMGTPAYMSPEQAAGSRGQIDAATDIYSLGAILYHMLTGHPPFQAPTAVDTLLMVLEQDPVLPRMLNPHVDRSLEMIALRCLQKPVDLRYQSAEALAGDLSAYLNNESISARDGRFSQVIASWFRETHHARVLENWGQLWIWHGIVLLLACVATNVMLWMGDLHRWHYSLMWSAGFGAWAFVFWWIRRRMGPVTFVERQIAHAWAASLACTFLLFPIEAMLNFPVLSLAPVLALFAGTAFLIKAAILSGEFYFPSVILFLTAPLMAAIPRYSIALFGLIAGGCFFVYGVKLRSRKRRNQRLA